MTKCTIFAFTLPSGEHEEVLFENDYIEQVDLREGERVRIVPSSGTFSVLVRPLPDEERGMPYRIMAIANETLKLHPPHDPGPREACVLYLAHEGTSSAIH